MVFGKIACVFFRDREQEISDGLVTEYDGM